MMYKFLMAASLAVVAVAGFDARKPQPAAGPWSQEIAVPAATIADSMGVNVHLNYASYSSRYDAFKKLLIDSGLRHIRNSVSYEDPQPSIDKMNDLSQDDVKSDVVFDSRTNASQLQSLIRSLKPALEIVEGANEYNLSHQPNWADHVIAYQKVLYATAHAAGLPVIGPSMTSSSAYEKVGDLHEALDYGNMHNYFSGFNPGTVGWGGAYQGDLYGSLAYNMRVARLVSGNKPIMSTETGYCTLVGTRNAVTPEIAARYLPRLYLEQWLAHVPRTYVYEFIDEGQPGCDSNLGLVKSDLVKKPGYVAVQSLAQDLNHAQAVLNHAKVSLHLGGDLNKIRHLLVQTNAHHVQLFIWNESPSWDTNKGQGSPVNVASRNIDLAVKAPWKIVGRRAFADSGKLENVQSFAHLSHATIPVSDHMAIVDVTNE